LLAWGEMKKQICPYMHRMYNYYCSVSPDSLSLCDVGTFSSLCDYTRQISGYHYSWRSYSHNQEK
jgi:hypothetical protein